MQVYSIRMRLKSNLIGKGISISQSAWLSVCIITCPSLECRTGKYEREPYFDFGTYRTLAASMVYLRVQGYSESSIAAGNNGNGKAVWHYYWKHVIGLEQYA